MRRWVVTGPIAAGKSAFTSVLSARGAVIVDGDELGHRVLAEPGIVRAVADEFGADCVRDGRVDRTVLGPRVFADGAALERLNGLTHPRLSALATASLDALDHAGGPALAVLEAAVYFLLPDRPRVDLTVTVTAPEDIRAARLAEARGLPADEALRRIVAQRGMMRAWLSADVVVENDGRRDRLAEAAETLWIRHVDPGTRA